MTRRYDIDGYEDITCLGSQNIDVLGRLYYIILIYFHLRFKLLTTAIPKKIFLRIAIVSRILLKFSGTLCVGRLSAGPRHCEA